MRERPPMILKSENKAAQTYAPAVRLAPLLKFLFDGAAFDCQASEKENIRSIPKLSAVMFERVKSDPKFSKLTATTPGLKGRADEQKLYGVNRLENLKAGGTQCTIPEAKWFHWAFENILGVDWAHEFPPKSLVTTPFLKLLQQARSKKLGWPETLNAVWRLQSLFSSFRAPELELSLIEMGMKAGESSLRKSNIRASGNDPVHMPKILYNMELQGIAGGQSVFLMEAYDQLVDIGDNIKARQVYPQRLLKVDGSDSVIKINHADGVEFRMNELPGSFQYYAVCFPETWNFKTEFSASPDADSWSEEETRNFVHALQARLVFFPNEVRLATYRYRVPAILNTKTKN